MTIQRASALVHLGIPALALAVAALFALGAWAAGRPGGALAATRLAWRAVLAVSGLLAVTGALAASGVLADASRRPPLFMPMMMAVVVGTVLVARSALGRRIALGLPLWALVGAQGFRLPLELVMRQAARDGVMPIQMSFEGYNFDVVTGVTALALAVALRSARVPRGIVLAWNVVGTALLAVVVGIALASVPWIGAFGPGRINDFVLYFPYVWLPTVLVPAALFGHLAVYRRLGAERPHAESGESPLTHVA